VLSSVALAAMLVGCGGTIAFADAKALVVTGTPPPPAPPPAPPPPPEPAPAPKRVEITADKIVITEKVQFDYNKATIKTDSNSLLDEIASVIKSNPQLRKISIEGHTDSDGSDAYNLKLSRDRAGSVMRYLVEHGVDAGRLVSAGFGEQKPIAGNDTAEGKEKNRRVEFLITEQDEVKKVYELDPKTGEKRVVESKEQRP
jgi:OOP family OmpA-OmpF porin